MKMERLELIKELNNKVLRCLNNMSSTELNGLLFDYTPGSDFTCEAQRNNNTVNMTIEEMQQINDFFEQRLSIYGIGVNIEQAVIHLGTAHLSTTKLKELHNTVQIL
ncbi:hypothetical protein [Phocaeicola barnesiae]|uniref:hypothetical protein n=1 Tax=Phocaeicola barnesiae TaxID=376804 RepID=UPI00242E4AD8|nr:hypothetical protein [Phocaeicola barnesiae]